MPGLLRVAINVLLIVGVLAMHHLILESATATPAHHEMTLVSNVSDVVDTETAATIAKVAHPANLTPSPLSDCGGLMMLCLAMILGVSAYIVLRKRLSDRVLWQLPPPLRLEPFTAVAQFNTQSPLQRSSVLRC